ncbi:hypothetical protein D3C77_509050 [compost metagenome]
MFDPAFDVGAEQHQQTAHQGQGNLRQVAATPAGNGREQVEYQVHSQSLGQEILQQVVEEQLAARGSDQSRRFDLQKPFLFGFTARCRELFQRQAGALAEQLDLHPLGQAQGVHQELERQLIHRQQLLAGLEGLGRVQVVLGQAGLPGAQDAPVGVAELAVGASANADEIAKAPVVEVVAGGAAGLGVGRDFVLGVAVAGQ